MAGPGDRMAAAAGGRGHLRASHADREQVIGTLKAAFVQGRLTKAELDVRVGQTFAARTYADLAALTADLPAGLAATPPPRKPARARARPPMGKVVAVAALIIPPPAIFAAAFLTQNDQLGKLFCWSPLVFYRLDCSRGPDVRHLVPEPVPRAATAAARAARPGARR